MRSLITILCTVCLGLSPTRAQSIRYCIPLDSIAFYPTLIANYIPYDAQLIMSGENHGVNEGNDAKIFHLYQYLLTHKYVSHIVWEAGPSFNWYFQRYLNSGDSTLLRYLTQNNALHSRGFFESLYALHQTQPISSVGLDMDFWQNFSYPMHCLQYIDSLHLIPSDAMTFFRLTLDSMLRISHVQKEKKIHQLLDRMHRDSAELKRVLQQDYDAYTSIISCLHQSLHVMNKQFFGPQRERYLTTQFRKKL